MNAPIFNLTVPLTFGDKEPNSVRDWGDCKLVVPVLNYHVRNREVQFIANLCNKYRGH